MHHQIIVLGNLGSKPEMRFLPNGTPVTSFTVATNYQFTNANGEKIKQTTWFRVSVWGKMGEACNQYLDKGSKVYLEGRLTPDKASGGPRLWNKGDGSPAASYEVTASTVRFLSSRGEVSDSGPISAGGMEMAELPPEDDIPF